MAGLIEQPKHYTRAEAQQEVRERGSSLVLRRSALEQMAELRSKENDGVKVDHADLQTCLTNCVVIEEIFYARGGALVTAAGVTCDGAQLTVYVYMPDDEDLPLFVDGFVLKPE